jgi:hypothetical protein
VAELSHAQYFRPHLSGLHAWLAARLVQLDELRGATGEIDKSKVDKATLNAGI